MTLEAQFMTNGLLELGIVEDTPLPFVLEVLTWARTAAACAGVGNVKKQYPGLLVC